MWVFEDKYLNVFSSLRIFQIHMHLLGSTPKCESVLLDSLSLRPLLSALWWCCLQTWLCHGDEAKWGQVPNCRDISLQSIARSWSAHYLISDGYKNFVTLDNKKAVVETEYNYKQCCYDEDGKVPLNSLKWEADSCSQRVCHYSKSMMFSVWISSQVGC